MVKWAMLLLALDCGRKVWLSALDYSRTYANSLEGRPNAKLNGRIIEQALTEREKTWGKRTTYLVPPTLDRSDPDHPVLPPVLLRAWLYCSVPVDPKFHGSELVVVWLTEECHSEPIADAVSRAVRGLPWEQRASDFYW